MTVKGKVVFMRTNDGRIINKHVIFPELSGSTRIIEHLMAFVGEHGPNIEGKEIEVTFKVIE